MIVTADRQARMEVPVMKEPCCPNVCDFRPERTRFWLWHLQMARLSNFDPVEAAKSTVEPSLGRCPGVRPDSKHDELEVIAIMEALPKPYTISDLRNAQQNIDAFCQSLCPYAVGCKLDAR